MSIASINPSRGLDLELHSAGLPTNTIMTTNNANNDCVICLESLATDTVGACVPCGHCFHEKCWQHYKSSSSGRGRIDDDDDNDGVGVGNGLKCPMCNGISNVFVKIFIDFNEMQDNNNNDENDNDNASLSSVESSSSPNNNKQNDNANDRIAMPNFVDLVNDNEENSNNNNENHHRRRVQKYKRKGKALNKNVEQCKSQILQSNNELEQLEQKYRKVQVELQAFQAQHEDLVQEDYECRRELEGTHLACITASRKLQQTKASIVQLQQELATAVANLEEYTKLHKQNIAKAYKKSMNQADEILGKHPKAIHQQSLLRKQNEKLRTQFNNLRKNVQQQGASRSSSTIRNIAPPVFKAKKQMKRMNSTGTAPAVSTTTTAPARASASVATKMRENVRGVVISQEEQEERDENQTEATRPHQQQQPDRQHYKHDNESSNKVKRKVSEQAARMDFLSRKAPKRGALELLQRTTSTSATTTTTKASSSSSSFSGTTANRTAAVTNGVAKRSTTTATAPAQLHQHQQANTTTSNSNVRRQRPSWRMNEFGLAVPTTPPTPTMGRFHASSSSSYAN